MKRLRRLALACAFGAAVASPAWLVLAEGDPVVGNPLVRADVADAGADGDAGRAPSPSDPVPLTTKNQWVLDLRWHQGALALRGARRLTLERPTPTARRMGRFAVELWVGRELVDRVRFDFPLLGADEFAGQKRPWNAPPSFERKLTTSAAVMIPHSERVTRIVVVDRATGETTELPSPLDAARDAGAAPAPATSVGAGG